jgi:hypothetical protein
MILRVGMQFLVLRGRLKFLIFVLIEKEDIVYFL